MGFDRPPWIALTQTWPPALALNSSRTAILGAGLRQFDFPPFFLKARRRRH